nr:uncharacterized protein LOC129383157 [Dermacentor andersoni]
MLSFPVFLSNWYKRRPHGSVDPGFDNEFWKLHTVPSTRSSKMNAKAILAVLAVYALLVAGTSACGGEGRSESGRCGGGEGRNEQEAAEARLDSAAMSSESARCGGQSGRCDG